MAKTIAQELAAEAKNLTFRELPPEVVKMVKSTLLDTLGVAFGGYLSEPSKIIQNMIQGANEWPESTVFGSGLKTSCLYATLANGVMVRYLDYMDKGSTTRDATDSTGHNSEAIAPILAVAERQHSTGQEVITAIVLAYELLNKIVDALGGEGAAMKDRGYTQETIKTPCVMALAAGKLLGSNEEQMANGLALAASFIQELNILGSPEEEMCMARNIKFPYAAYHGILGATLSQKGFKGPLDVVEGRHGLAEVIMGGEIDLQKLRQPRKDWTILNTWFKRFAAAGSTQGFIDAIVTLVREHKIKAEDVAAVTIKLRPSYYKKTTGAHKYPDTKETADHSAYYCTAIAILDAAVGPAQFSDEKLRDPRVKQLIDKIVFEPEPKLNGFGAPAIAEITTENGEKYTYEVLRPKGHPMNPMSDADLEEKFQSMARTFMDQNQMRRLIDTIDNLDRLEDIGDLIKLAVFPSPVNGSS